MAKQRARRVLQAAIDSILEKGYYQTSSNEIARRAGVTWGAIQHQFGTREQLLLEVMNDRWHMLQEQVATARIDGETLEDRLAEVVEGPIDALRRPRRARAHADHARSVP